jgi:hypothetical protein
MPGGDRTGPLGYGPMTGRGAGYCAGYVTPGYGNPAFGRGRGSAEADEADATYFTRRTAGVGAV